MRAWERYFTPFLFYLYYRNAINTGIDGTFTGENKRRTNPKTPKCLFMVNEGKPGAWYKGQCTGFYLFLQNCFSVG